MEAGSQLEVLRAVRRSLVLDQLTFARREQMLERALVAQDEARRDLAQISAVLASEGTARLA